MYIRRANLHVHKIEDSKCKITIEQKEFKDHK